LNTQSSISFVVEGVIPVEDLGMYLAPELATLGDYSETKKKEPFQFPTNQLILWIVLLIVGAFVVYVALQEWYKRSYEQHLFGNPDDLYNMIHFIYNARRSSMSDGAIREKLGESLWNGEQMRYAFRKLDGKRTGMFEIPLFAGRERRRVAEEIAKRQRRQG
jgi:hypothetical protein